MCYRLHNCPLGATAADVVRAAGELVWPIIPQRQTIHNQVSTWIVTAEAAPKIDYFRWADRNVVIHNQDLTEMKEKGIAEKNPLPTRELGPN